jgi:hypothetical protein
MKKITLLLLFCICAVGFSQAQTKSEGSGTATSNESKSVSRSIDATDLDTRKSTVIKPKKAVQQGAVKDLLSLGLERNAVLTPKKTVQQGELKDVISLGLERNAVFNSKKATFFKAPENGVSTHLINHNSNSVELLDGATAVSGQVTITTGPYNGRSFNQPNGTRLMPVLAYESGPYFSVAGPPDRSVLETTTLGMTTLGAGVQITAGNRMAEDIVLSDDYDVTSIDFFGYQTNAPTAPASINEINVQIWDGDPSVAGSSVIWGDDVTNVLTSAIWSDAYRDTETTVGATNRAIQRITVETPGLSLVAGTYWVDYSMGGTAASGPWQPPVVILGQTMTGNAQQSIAGVWGPFLDGGTATQLGAPVQVNGDCTSCGGGPVFPAPYCGPLVFANDVEPITLVDVAGISNVTDATVNGSPSHEDFTAILGAMEEGMSYSIALEGNTAGNFTNRFAVFIDWNQNDILDDAGEVYEITETIVNSTGTDGQQATGTIVVPAGVTAGDTRMRVKKIFGTNNYLDPCLGTGFGQAEDYTITVSTSGGGGGMACNEENPSNGFENAFFSGTGATAPLQVIATDMTIPADTDFSLTSVNANLWIRGMGETITAADIVIYGDSGGLPDAANVIASFPGLVPASQPSLGTAFTAFEVFDVTFDVPATMLAGQAGATTTYWVSIYGTASNADDVLWESTSATVVGNEGAFSVDNAASWAGYTTPSDLVYNFSGDCTPIGGGGGTACNEENLSNSFENAFFSGTGATAPLQVIATDMTIPADTDFSLTSVNANLWIRGMGETITAADIVIYGDSGGLPDAANVIASFPGLVPASQPSLGTAFTAFEVFDVTFDVPATMLAGQAGATTTYWVSIYGTASNADDVLWESTSATVVGNEGAFSVDNAASWAGYTTPSDLVYNFSGECMPIGGGGGPCTPGSIATLFAGGNGGNQGGAVYFDITVGASDIDVLTLDMNTPDPGAFTMDVYVFEGTYVGNEANPAPWGTAVAIGSGTGAGAGVASTATLDNPITMSAGATYAVALVFDASHAHQYTNGDGTNQNYTNADITLDLGSGSNLPFVGPTFNPRVWNGGVGYCVDNGGPTDNDTCADAIAVVCGDIIVSDTLTNTDTGGNPAADEWYKFTGTGTPELVTISLCDGGTDYDSLLRVFSDCTLANEIATNDDFCGLQSELSFASDGTSTYYIMVEGFASAAGNFSLAVTCTTGPDNDSCAGALPIACGEIVAGTTIDATEDSAVAPTCDTSVTSPGVWYVYEDTTGLITDITITMCNGTTDYDSKLSVYTGDCGAPPLNCIVGNDDTCGLQSEVSFQSDGATTFYILVHGFGGQTGNFEIEMNCTPIPPPNDMIANSIDVDEIGFPYTDPSVAMPAATFEAGSPVDCDNSGARGVWYNFVPEGDGTATATITTPGGALFFTVNNGPLAGSYNAIAAAFGGEFTATVITEDSVVILDDDTTGDPNDACDPILNGADLSGKIAITRRGACAFTDKVIAAQNAGAIAVIVVNNQPGGPIVMGGANPDITIPALMLGDVDGEAIIAELSGASVNVSMGLAPAGFSAVTFYTAPNENAVETDLVLVDWFENQCLPGSTASIPTVAGQAYYVFVANHGSITDIVIDGTNLGTVDNTIEGFVYYPNPTESILTLSAQDTIESVAIYNMLGQKVVDQNVNAIRSEINVSELATGAYLMRVSVNGQIGTYKILKK